MANRIISIAISFLGKGTIQGIPSMVKFGNTKEFTDNLTSMEY